ncbi:MAG: HAMP domain-containing sensor histidine kinase [Pseudomonadota bacterium]
MTARRHWRPGLAFVLGGALGATLAFSFFGLVALRYLGPEFGYRNAALALGLLIAVATAVLAWLLVRLLLGPIRGLERYAAAQEAGRAAEPLVHFGTRELHRTAHRVMDMAEALRDREATIRAYTDHVTHELKTPVAAIRAAVELLEDGDDPALLAQIDGAREQIERQLSALRRAARAREARYVGQSSLAEVAPPLQAENPALTLALAGDSVAIPIAADGLTLVLGQLLRNAAEHGAKAVSLQASAADAAVSLVVQDDGEGISPGNADRVFDPFFTTRREAGGTGMGLAIIRNILAAHRAEIAHIPSERGAQFLLTWPRG